MLEQDEEETATASQEKGANGNGSGKANDVTRRGFTSEEEGRKALEQIKDAPFTITSVTKKNGTEAPPRLYDLTSLQVECNRKFSFSSDLTLQLIQSLYEKKFTTYPRVDTTFLSDDIYPKCNAILNGIAGEYAALLQPLRGAALKKSKKVFDSSKVTDHHAIIPTGVAPHGLTPDEQRVFDLVARRFIAAFYPDCKFATTTILGETADIPFKATGNRFSCRAGGTCMHRRPKQRKPWQKPPRRNARFPLSRKAKAALTYRTWPKNGHNRPNLTQKPRSCAPWRLRVAWWTTTNCVMP